MEPEENVGKHLINLARRLYPINRSLTGAGVRETLSILSEFVPLNVIEVPSGARAFDWTVPDEWKVTTAFIENSKGVRLVDFSDNNLHLVGYSEPVDCQMMLKELQPHLHSLPDQPDAIPYRTSYYKKSWGFCLTHNQRESLQDDMYHVVIDSNFTNGSLTYGELVIPGKSEKEIFISTYICHPSMANNELSGPVIATYLAIWLLAHPRNYSYRLVFLPETIGPLVYLQKHLDKLKRKVLSGFNLSCLGDDRCYSFVSSRYGNTLADRIAERALKKRSICGASTERYSFLERQSDERQYCSPGVDLPLVTLCRSRFGTYPEYHTSLDNFDLVTAEGLQGGYEYVLDCVMDLEQDIRYKATQLGEPQLGRRGLYPTQGSKDSGAQPGSSVILKSVNFRNLLNVLAYSDGTNSIQDISDRLDVDLEEIQKIYQILIQEDLVVQG